MSTIRHMPTARRRLSPEDRRAELLALGAEVFGKRPYDEVRIDEIAERAGVSRALMYHYFPDKRAFFAAVVKDEADRLYEATNDPPPTRAISRAAYLSVSMVPVALRSSVARQPAVLSRAMGPIEAEPRALAMTIRSGPVAAAAARASATCSSSVTSVTT